MRPCVLVCETGALTSSTNDSVTIAAPSQRKALMSDRAPRGSMRYTPAAPRPAERTRAGSLRARRPTGTGRAARRDSTRPAGGDPSSVVFPFGVRARTHRLGVDRAVEHREQFFLVEDHFFAARAGQVKQRSEFDRVDR